MSEKIAFPVRPVGSKTVAPRLARLLAEAAKNPPTEEQLRQQRLSWVRAEAGFGSDRDEMAYLDALLAKDHDTLWRLDADAQRRMDAAERILAKSDKP